MRESSFRTSSLTMSMSLLLAATLGFVGCKKNDESNAPSGGDDGADAADSGDAPADTGGDASTGGDAESGGEASGWAGMDRDARLTFMGTEVMPKMKEAFKQQGFDTFKCANCHGEDYKDVDFKMPNDLTPLNPDNPIQSGMDLDEEMTKFMVSVVTPQMAELLGKTTDVTTGKGEFGCLSCHLSE